MSGNLLYCIESVLSLTTRAGDHVSVTRARSRVLSTNLCFHIFSLVFVQIKSGVPVNSTQPVRRHRFHCLDTFQHSIVLTCKPAKSRQNDLLVSTKQSCRKRRGREKENEIE